MSETFRKFRSHLTNTVNYYNSIQRNCRKVEFNLIELEVARIDSLIRRGENDLKWSSDCLLDYMTEISNLVENLYKRVKSAQNNVEKIRTILEPWTKIPLIERKDRKKDTLLSIEERSEKVLKRYSEIRKGSEHIHLLLTENQEYFEINDENNEAWKNYVNYVDKIVIEALRKAIGCSLSYFVENMDIANQNYPLLEARLELREPDIFYVPSLDPDDPDGLEQLINDLLQDIIGIAQLVERVKKNNEPYKEEIEKDEDICAMKNEILLALHKAIDEATEFCEIFEGRLFRNCYYSKKL